MISIVIPTFNEQANVGRLIHYLKENSSKSIKEIIVANWVSEDSTVELAGRAGAITVLFKDKCRAAQINYGAERLLSFNII